MCERERACKTREENKNKSRITEWNLTSPRPSSPSSSASFLTLLTLRIPRSFPFPSSCLSTNPLCLQQAVCSSPKAIPLVLPDVQHVMPKYLQPFSPSRERGSSRSVRALLLMTRPLPFFPPQAYYLSRSMYGCQSAKSPSGLELGTFP